MNDVNTVIPLYRSLLRTKYFLMTPWFRCSLHRFSRSRRRALSTRISPTLSAGLAVNLIESHYLIATRLRKLAVWLYHLPLIEKWFIATIRVLKSAQ